MLIRLSKVIVLSASAIFLLLVSFNNVTDYDSNFHFVQHVLSMDTSFPGNTLMWRAITSPSAHKVLYAGIICWEALCGCLIAFGTFKLFCARSASAAVWEKTKGIAAIGLTLSLFQWYFGFLTVGAEWFLMWQSKTWNGQDAAFRMFAIMGISLVYLVMKDDEISKT